MLASSNYSTRNGIALEWKEIIYRNLKLPVSSVCKLPDAIISINTGDATPSYIRQYPIPQAIQGKVKARIDEWLKNNWIIEAPSNCRCNSPILAGLMEDIMFLMQLFANVNLFPSILPAL